MTTRATGGGGSDDAAEGNIVAADFSLTDITVLPGEPIALTNDGEQRTPPRPTMASSISAPWTPARPPSRVPPPIEPGDYPFHCEIHPNMTATLTVEG